MYCLADASTARGTAQRTPIALRTLAVFLSGARTGSSAMQGGGTATVFDDVAQCFEHPPEAIGF